MQAGHLPPADIPEDRLFLMLQRQRRALVGWLDTATPATVNRVLGATLKIALRGASLEVQRWKRDGPGTGRYTAEDAELQVCTDPVLYIAHIPPAQVFRVVTAVGGLHFMVVYSERCVGTGGCAGS